MQMSVAGDLGQARLSKYINCNHTKLIKLIIYNHNLDVSVYGNG